LNNKGFDMVDWEDSVYVVVPCAGHGSRAQTDQPKQYMVLNDQPLVMHTLNAFSAVKGIAKGVLVVSSEDSYIDALIQKFPQPLFSVSYTGGATRTASVLSGLVQLQKLGAKNNDWVMVHDAARCLITPDLIESLMRACRSDDVGGLLALPLADTLKSEIHGRVASTLNRSDKWLAQTPQMFRLGSLMQALSRDNQTATDEASSMELLGLSPLLVKGATFNFKVTFAEDFDLARAVLQSRFQHNTGLKKGSSL
jgi:2-C-methyl-D-erythritol 4-phosphate cytidylyltransferase